MFLFSITIKSAGKFSATVLFFGYQLRNRGLFRIFFIRGRFHFFRRGGGQIFFHDGQIREKISTLKKSCPWNPGQVGHNTKHNIQGQNIILQLKRDQFWRLPTMPAMKAFCPLCPTARHTSVPQPTYKYRIRQ